MSTSITNVTELQAMEDDLTEDYILANNIDASATSGWNDGAGFDPVGDCSTHSSYSYPAGDLRIEGDYVYQYPDEDYFYQKVDEEVEHPPDDNDYNYQVWGNEAWFVYAASKPSPVLPEGATNICVNMIQRAYRDGTNRHHGVLRLADTDYLTDNYWLPPDGEYETTLVYATYINPHTGENWTVSDINDWDIQGFGWYVNWGNGESYVSQMYLRIDYELVFSGTFDGNTYAISDLYINRSTENCVGLFGKTNLATVHDVVLTSADITGKYYTGSVIGYCGGSTVTECEAGGSVTGTRYVGGIIGLSGQDSNDEVDTTISDLSSSCTLTGTGNYWGGLIGYTDDTTVSQSTNSGAVTSSGSYVGGLIGWCQYSTVDESYGTGNVSGLAQVGGLIGRLHYSTLGDSYARGNATGSATSTYAGGLVGRASSSTVDNSYSTGIPTGTNYTGGLVGYEYDSEFTGSFWDTETSGTETSDGGTGKTTADMKVINIFQSAGWDIQNTETERNNNYPFLSWEIGESETIWLIYGGEEWLPFTFPDLLDDHGRAVKNARIIATRTDTHEDIETQYTDANGSATFYKLAQGVDTRFHASWGGTSIPSSPVKERWFFLDFKDIEDGGTNAYTPEDARDNLGMSLLWELVFGD